MLCCLYSAPFSLRYFCYPSVVVVLRLLMVVAAVWCCVFCCGPFNIIVDFALLDLREVLPRLNLSCL